MITGYQALREGVGLLDLSARGKIRVTGEDRARLLHAMSTNHVEGLSAGNGLYTFFLNDRGRVLADAYIYNPGESLLLDTEAGTGRKLIEHLDRFIIADDVTLEDQTDSLAAFGVEGPLAAETASKLGLALSAERFGVARSEGVLTANVTSTGAPGFRLFIPAAEKEIWAGRFLETGAVTADANEANIVRLENGVPRYGEDISDRQLVQETGLLHAVHFSKGCYLGQEIVERVRSRGQVRRFLMPVRIDGRRVPSAGLKVSSAGSEVGELCSAAFSPASNEIVGLAYLRSEAIEAGAPMTVGEGDAPAAVEIREGVGSLVTQQPA